MLLGVDEQIADMWARVTAHRRSLGRPIECGDRWIAATALRHGLPLVTHNARNYRDIPGLTLISHGAG